MRVLIVDDSRTMRMIILRSLRQSNLPISDVGEAADGVEALAAVGTFAPTLILSDWNMPNMTGIELLHALRDSGSTAVFGFVTSEANPVLRERAINAGASFVLTKPFNGERLAEVVGEVMGEADDAAERSVHATVDVGG